MGESRENRPPPPTSAAAGRDWSGFCEPVGNPDLPLPLEIITGLVN